jgi:quinol monooxygenase YgiN
MLGAPKDNQAGEGALYSFANSDYWREHESNATGWEYACDTGSLINVFAVDPTKQRQLIELLIRATTTTVGHVAGFISASFNRSFDGTKVTVYAQWRSKEDWQAMRANPAASLYMEQVLTLAKFEPDVRSCGNSV